MFWVCFRVYGFPGGCWANCAGGCLLGWASTGGELRVLPVCTEGWPVSLTPLHLLVCVVFVCRWCALVDVGVLVCLVRSLCVPVGFCCMLGVLGASIGGIRSRWTRMFFSVAGVAISGWAWGLQGRRGTSYCFDIYFFHFLLICD